MQLPPSNRKKVWKNASDQPSSILIAQKSTEEVRRQVYIAFVKVTTILIKTRFHNFGPGK